MDVTKIDRLINNVVNFQTEEAIQKEAQKVAVQKEPPSISIQESVLVVQEETVKIVAPSTSIPQIPEQEGNAVSVPQLLVHAKESTIKTRKQQTFYEWLLAPLTSEEKWECENLEEELS
ncbi:hypothetical protein D8674_024373 [Pyrus ussuriensis x Pyrus communis]|uniref:Uncharacterized protein n=1 Tax=Pyrus ussuriensis x Pyrus communis TaxID=2448454 RepID=A0A5N5H7P7_9ROSA|nr:hypothetical protein D8674_024373 [Pyrus ussuriensis x Pyrus communis]